MSKANDTDGDDAQKSSLLTNRVAIAAATGIGSAALLAALFYARRDAGKTSDDKTRPVHDATD